MEHTQVIYKVGYFMPDLNGYIWNQFKDEKLAEDKARSLKESGYDVLVQKKYLINLHEKARGEWS